MKIDFPITNDGKLHRYCPDCHSQNIQKVVIKEKIFDKCKNCGKISSHLIVIDPRIVWWIDTKNKEYWHESVGVILYNSKKQILLFERTIYPFAYTIPAGHLDIGEKPKAAVIREVIEETGIHLTKVRLFSEEDVIGDECRGGASNHRWHLFTAELKGNENIEIREEGINPTWLTIKDALKKDLVYPLRYFFNKYSNGLTEK